MTASHVPTRSHRDHRLDFWRGLCLVDMVLVHLVAQGMRFGPVGHEFFTNYTRFAAGGYVMLSGMTVGFVFFPRVVEGARRWDSYLRLWRRALVILLVHFAVTLGEILVLVPARGEPLPPIGQTMLDILMFREGYDLLPFYIFMVALSPLVMELLRRGLGWVVLAASAGLFLWTHYDKNWVWVSFQITNTFFFGLWQVLFLLGLYAGTKLRRYDTLATPTKAAVAGGCWVASLAIFVLAFGHHFGIGPVPSERPLSPLTFWKSPLTLGEILRYVALVGAIVTTSDLLWHRLRSWPLTAMVNRLGRRSLAMYLTQIYLVAVIDRIADRAGGPWGTQFLWMTLAIILLWSFALLLDAAQALQHRFARRGFPVTLVADAGSPRS